MLLMDGLFGDAELGGDLRPGPSEVPSSIDMEGLQPLRQLPQRRHGMEPDGRIAAPRLLSQLGRGHLVKLSCRAISVNIY
jgi:hypothetical protein